MPSGRSQATYSASPSACRPITRVTTRLAGPGSAHSEAIIGGCHTGSFSGSGLVSKTSGAGRLMRTLESKVGMVYSAGENGYAALERK